MELTEFASESFEEDPFFELPEKHKQGYRAIVQSTINESHPSLDQVVRIGFIGRVAHLHSNGETAEVVWQTGGTPISMKYDVDELYLRAELIRYESPKNHRQFEFDFTNSL
jgi:hypothetical protein